MASGDAQRIWFPAAVDELRDRWSRSLTMAELVTLRDHLDAVVQRIRAEAGILPAKTRSGAPRRRGLPRVSVRSMIVALGRFGIAPEIDVEELDLRWKRYRSEHRLDPYGKQTEPTG